MFRLRLFGVLRDANHDHRFWIEELVQFFASFLSMRSYLDEARFSTKKYRVIKIRLEIEQELV